MRLQLRRRVLLVVLGAVLATIVSNSALPAVARAAASKVTVTLTPSTIVADGHSQTLAVAVVTGPRGHLQSGQTISFSSTDPGQPASIPASEISPGVYAATITSTTTVGVSTITATDQTAGISGSAILTQTAGSTAEISVTLTPSTIPADGVSKTVAAAALTDAEGDPLVGQTVSFSSSDPGQPASIPASETSPGIYTATITSTTNVGTSTITAADTAAGISASATLTQTTTTGTFIVLTLTPSTIVADGQSKTVAAATIVDAAGGPVSGDSVAFSASDAGVRFSPVTASNGTYMSTLTSSTRAGAVAITATDRTTGGSTGTVLTQVHGPASEVTITLSRPAIVADGISTNTATISVADAHGNPISGDPIKLSVSDNRVRVGAVLDQGSGVYTVVLTSSTIPRRVTVTATDAAEWPPASGRAAFAEVPAPSLVGLADMRWSFYYTPRYTVIETLALKGPLGDSMITIGCRGGGCPFATRNVALAASRHCRTVGKQRRCSTAVHYDVARDFRGRRLSAGVLVSVDVLRRGWIGKYYAFKIRPGRGPKLQISCLAPGGRKPGVGCQS
jgi:Invasin, domain 3